MGIVVNTNVPAMMVQRNLSTATDNLKASLERLTTGLKINRAADDAAGLYLANGLERQIRGSEICQDSVQTGMNILQLAEGDLSLIQEHLLRIRDLAVQAASDYYTPEARAAMKDEAAARIAEIDRLANASNFNGKLLLAKTGSITTLALQVGPNTDDSLSVSGVFGDATASTLGLTTDVATAFATASAAADYISECDTALTAVNNRFSSIGAAQNRLESAYDSLVISVENLSAAKSTIVDADIAKESTEFAKQQILQQTAASLMVQANQSPAIALNLI